MVQRLKGQKVKPYTVLTVRRRGDPDGLAFRENDVPATNDPRGVEAYRISCECRGMLYDTRIPGISAGYGGIDIH